jgi:hypothetical protein
MPNTRLMSFCFAVGSLPYGPCTWMRRNGRGVRESWVAASCWRWHSLEGIRRDSRGYVAKASYPSDRSLLTVSVGAGPGRARIVRGAVVGRIRFLVHPSASHCVVYGFSIRSRLPGLASILWQAEWGKARESVMRLCPASLRGSGLGGAGGLDSRRTLYLSKKEVVEERGDSCSVARW